MGHRGGGVDGITDNILKANILTTATYLEKMCITIWSEETTIDLAQRPDSEDTKER